MHIKITKGFCSASTLGLRYDQQNKHVAKYVDMSYQRKKNTNCPLPPFSALHSTYTAHVEDDASKATKRKMLIAGHCDGSPGPVQH